MPQPEFLPVSWALMQAVCMWGLSAYASSASSCGDMTSTMIAYALAASTTDDYHDLLEVENLLESYYMIVDSTHGKLASIGEYIDDTEDYVNIELDYSRNRLLRIEILLTIATFSLAVYNLVAGVLGENLVLPDAITRDIRGFIIINVSTTVFVVSAFVLIWRIMRKKKLV